MARELGLLRGFLQGEPGACVTIAKNLDVVVAALERTQAIAAPMVGQQVAYGVARLLTGGRR